jgi:hypothetical protein
MTITRILPGVVLVALTTTAPAVGQFRMPPYSPPGHSGEMVPSVFPDAVADPVAPPDMGQPGMPPVAPPARSLERMTAPLPTGVADPVGTLAGPPGPAGLPPGSYRSPWYADGPGCCGPLGAHGQVAYELYLNTGPNMVFGSGEFTDRLNVGWIVGGGGRSMFFNPEGDAAWVIDLGLSYTYNRGSSQDFSDLFLRQQPLQDATTGQLIPQPDRLATSRIRGLHRTSFNFAVGRDWFRWGPGIPGGEPGWNVRVGADVGGRWGTSHIDVVPLDEGPNGYARRQKVFHGLFIGGHANCEVPLGGWIWTSGLTVQWGYDWMDIAPPLKGDIQNVNFLLSTGFRF